MLIRTPRAVFLLPLVFVLGAAMARLPATLKALDGDEASFLGPIADVEQLLNEAYVEKPDLAALQKGAVDGMLEALNDPYAQYIPASERAEFEKEIVGQFVGIGAEVEVNPPLGGYLTIVSPMEDSPAFEAGILAGDRITEIEGQSTLGLSIDDCIKKLTGKPGTPVNLTIQRNGANIPMSIVRREIVVHAVKGFRRDPGAQGAGPGGQAGWDYLIDPQTRIAYIRLTQFIPAAPDEFDDALTALKAEQGGISGLILDLRDNPGGDLAACLDIADRFIKSGVLVSVRGRNGEEEVHKATGEGTLPDFPMEVLVNGASASASEILSGALADHSRATIIGARTFGKGLVQTVVPLRHSNGSEVKFTIQRYYLPSGRLIHRTDESTMWGVDPTPGFYVPMTEQEQLAMLLKRRDLDIIRTKAQDPGQNSAPAAQEKWSDPDWVESYMKDHQLGAALRAMQLRLTTGEWRPVSDSTQQAVNINMNEFHRLERVHQRVLREMMRLEKRLENMETALAGSVKPRQEPDLWPDDLDLSGGEVRVTDKQGNEVADVRITGPDLERWLASADIEPVRTTAKPPPSQAKADPPGAAEPKPEKPR